ncbi:hypothetical protein ECG_03271 [Echinococcus granulosus]|uniref:Secreted protein n=1 Tax=Echinococcus granulosus TaxID=6210 RepID=A0A068X143_ECHGR|nr:hypothetical protein ECG_03271 [Echinococcus granulosus]CDS24481.1 hypothetical protein EgrG_000330400 [Echinococcus granulosus]
MLLHLHHSMVCHPLLKTIWLMCMFDWVISSLSAVLQCAQSPSSVRAHCYPSHILSFHPNGNNKLLHNTGGSS